MNKQIYALFLLFLLHLHCNLLIVVVVLQLLMLPMLLFIFLFWLLLLIMLFWLMLLLLLFLNSRNFPVFATSLKWKFNFCSTVHTIDIVKCTRLSRHITRFRTDLTDSDSKLSQTVLHCTINRRLFLTLLCLFKSRSGSLSNTICNGFSSVKFSLFVVLSCCFLILALVTHWMNGRMFLFTDAARERIHNRFERMLNRNWICKSISLDSRSPIGARSRCRCTQ